jgi:hypothetical protein
MEVRSQGGRRRARRGRRAATAHCGEERSPPSGEIDGTAPRRRCSALAGGWGAPAWVLCAPRARPWPSAQRAACSISFGCARREHCRPASQPASQPGNLTAAPLAATTQHGADEQAVQRGAAREGSRVGRTRDSTLTGEGRGAQAPARGSARTRALGRRARAGCGRAAWRRRAAARRPAQATAAKAAGRFSFSLPHPSSPSLIKLPFFFEAHRSRHVFH